MSQIKNLSDYDEQIEHLRAKWRKLVRPGRKADRERVKEGLVQAYQAVGVHAPRIVLWVDSPWELRRVGRLLAQWFDPIGGDINHGANKHRTILMDQVGPLAMIGRLQQRLTAFSQVHPDTRIESSLEESSEEKPISDLFQRVVIGIVTELLKGHSAADPKALELNMAQEAFLRVSEAAVFFQIVAMRSLVATQMREQCLGFSWFNSAGCHISPQVVDFLVNVLGSPSFDYFKGMQILAEENVWWAPFRDVAIVCDPPVVNLYDDTGAPTNHTGAVVKYSNGDAIYTMDRVVVPERYITSWSEVTAQEIMGVRNAEVRRVLMQRYGYERLMTDLDAKLYCKDDYGELYRLYEAQRSGFQYPIAQFVKVQNKTPEPDGSFKSYVLHIANMGINSPHAAVASTFGLRPEDYKPEWES